MKNIEAALVHDGRSVAFSGGERSGHRSSAELMFEPSDERRGGSDLIGEVGHVRLGRTARLNRTTLKP